MPSVPRSDRFVTTVSFLFGGMSLAMAAVVSLEIVSRKVFDVSLQGVNELSGYIMAVISCLAAAVAVPGRNHIRIDIIHYALPRTAQAALNLLSALSLAVLGTLLSYSAWRVLADSWDFRSTAATPWATPLIWPQSVWNLALLLFTVVAWLYAFRAVLLLCKGDVNGLVRDFQPRASRQEAEEELREARERKRWNTAPANAGSNPGPHGERP